MGDQDYDYRDQYHDSHHEAQRYSRPGSSYYGNGYEGDEGPSSIGDPVSARLDLLCSWLKSREAAGWQSLPV